MDVGLADMKTIIEMAREAGLWPAVTDTFPKELQAFAELVRADEREVVRRCVMTSPLRSVILTDGFMTAVNLPPSASEQWRNE